MQLISKLAALALFAAGAATFAATAPSSAQSQRQSAVQPGGVTPAACCRPATKIVATGSAGWTGITPSNQSFTPVPVVPKHPLWAPPLPGSQWIGPHHNSASASEPGGDYVYEYRFCLCPLPNGTKIVPATLSLRIWADDGFRATLNGSPVLAQHTGGWGFTTSPPAPNGLGAPPGGTAMVTSSYFLPCNNVLRFVVNNASGSPTGLDVYGTISGYFQDTPPGQPCCGRPTGQTENPN